MIKRTERGWPAHYICSKDCLFRRNTLLEKNEIKIIVSTVGNYIQNSLSAVNISEIGVDRYYETMVFKAKLLGAYWEADVHEEQIYFDSPWSINGEQVKVLKDSIDNYANDMHETVVTELVTKLEKQEI